MTARAIDAWTGPFGDAYTDRNVVDWRVRLPALREMLADVRIRSALEVGCNRGHNLVALRELLGPPAVLAGVEPNARARRVAARALPRSWVLDATADRLPFRDASFDLVLTWGVLIHVPPEALVASLREIRRVSRRYILAVEYGSERPVEVVYRGRAGLLWKRDFGAAYRALFPSLKPVRAGFLPEGALSWALLEAPPLGAKSRRSLLQTETEIPAGST